MAGAVTSEWVEDLRSRKLCCANGSGKDHGNSCDIEEQFSIGLQPFEGE